jgi:sec-independent protein translocase protein TatA
MIGTWEIVFTLFIVLLLFGGKRLPELARSLGQGIKEFKRASTELQDDVQISGRSSQPPPSENKRSSDE